MILLQPDYLVFRTSDGENIPASAQQVTVELIGESAALLHDEVIQNAAQAVLHYFKTEQGRTLVSVGEFAQALERVLRGLGFKVRAGDQGNVPGNVGATDLRLLAGESGKEFELGFFSRLRQELRRQLEREPAMIRFRGLRGCVKQLVGVQRWTPQCQELKEQIVEYLRRCLCTESGGRSCPLVVE